MSKLITWIIVVIVILGLAIAGVMIYNGDNSKNQEPNQQNTDSDLSNTPESEFSNLQTSDNDFNEIDSAIDYIE